MNMYIYLIIKLIKKNIFISYMAVYTCRLMTNLEEVLTSEQINRCIFVWDTGIQVTCEINSNILLIYSKSIIYHVTNKPPVLLLQLLILLQLLGPVTCYNLQLSTHRCFFRSLSMKRYFCFKVFLWF